MEEFKNEGNLAYTEGDYLGAVEAYSKAIVAAESVDPASLSVLYSNRSASYFCMENYEEALKDADKVVELTPSWPKGFSRRGSALVMLKNYEDAHKAFSTGLLFEPDNKQLQKGLKDAEQGLLKKSAKKRKLAELTDDFDCILCMKLLYDPVTTACGHSFCRDCLVRALDHHTTCPLCRAVVHMSADQPVSVVLQSIIQRNFPEDYALREKEARDEKVQESLSLPLFLINTVAFPKQSFPLHIFEPRYRLMVRRCLAGSRKFGLVCVTSSQSGSSEEIGCVLEIKNVRVLPDGRSFLDTVGTERFKILEKWVQDGYMCGKVQMIHDQVSDESSQEAQELMEQIKNTIQLVVEDSRSSHAATAGQKYLAQSLGEIPTHTDPEKFSFWLASKLPLNATDSMHLLQTTSTADRLRRELDYIEAKGSPVPSCRVQ